MSTAPFQILLYYLYTPLTDAAARTLFEETIADYRVAERRRVSFAA